MLGFRLANTNSAKIAFNQSLCRYTFSLNILKTCSSTLPVEFIALHNKQISPNAISILNLR